MTEVNNSKTSMYLFQFSYTYGKQIYLPYSVGMIWAYAKTIPEINNNIENKGFVIVREDPNVIVNRLENPKIVAFSTYVWNWEMSIAVARKIKEKFPDCLIIFGGPHVPNPDRIDNFYGKFPFIDIAVHGEGEITFSEILLAHINGKNYDTIPGLTYRGLTTEPRTRNNDLNNFPSPYLTGVFDTLFELPYEYHVVWETNRGCPYGCTFCDWGSLTSQRLYQFDEKRLEKELEFFAKRKISYIFLGDANFGMFPRDVVIAKKMALIKNKNGGYPDKVRLNYAKNNPDLVYEIAHILNKEKMDKGITLSVQSMDPNTLLTIKRTNLKYDTLSAFVKIYRQEGIKTYTEVIMGLPGETFESFRNGIDSLLDASAHDSLWMFRCSVLPNAPMNDPEYKKIHKIKTVRTPTFLNHTKPGADPIQEYDEVVLETATLSTNDYMKCMYLSWVVQTFHALGLLQVIAMYVKEVHGIQYTAFYERLLEYAEQNNNTMLGKEFAFIKNKIYESLINKKSWDVIVPEFNDLTWELEEASFLRMMLDAQTFYDEMRNFLKYLESIEKFAFNKEFLVDLLKYQEAIMVKIDKSGTTEFQTQCSIRSFHHQMLLGENTKLQQGAYNIRIHDPYNFNGDRKKYAMEVAFWGRREGKTFYQTCEEFPLSSNIVK